MVVTNVSSSQQTLEVLTQVPQGSVCVANCLPLATKTLQLGPYATQQLEYKFYFPLPGTFSHFPVHVASEEALVACARPTTLSVVFRPTVVDNTSWEYVSQQASLEDVCAYLDTQNLTNVRAMCGSCAVCRVCSESDALVLGLFRPPHAGVPGDAVLAPEGPSGLPPYPGHPARAPGVE